MTVKAEGSRQEAEGIRMTVKAEGSRQEAEGIRMNVFYCNCNVLFSLRSSDFVRG